jgi:hypothetical protein
MRELLCVAKESKLFFHFLAHELGVHFGQSAMEFFLGVIKLLKPDLEHKRPCSIDGY